jgi:hypothetical protein
MNVAPSAPAMRARSAQRGTVQVLGTILAFVLLLASAAYLFGQLWVGTVRSAETSATQRAALAYARPLNSLLATLVDAQYSATRGMAADEATIRAGVDEVNRVDRDFATRLRVEQRWALLAAEIDRTIGLKARGPGAVRAYGTPIALTRAMLDWLADSSLETGDPASPQHLIRAALHQLPDVVAAAGELAALAYTAENAGGTPSGEANRQLTIAQDRVTRISAEAGVVLRSGGSSSGFTADLQLLRPLDEFAAAADELGQTVSEPGPPGGAEDRLEAASSKVRTTAIALEAAALNAFDAQLTANTASNTTRQRLIILAGVVMALTIGGLLWLLTRSPDGPETPGPREQSGVGDDLPARADGTGAQRSPQPAHLVDARELLARESPMASRAVGARKR